MAAFDSALSDPYISNLLSTTSKFRKQPPAFDAMSSARTSMAPVSGQDPNLVQFIESVPPSITLLLVELAPVISWLRWAAEVVSWKSYWTDPWLTIAAWWALCLSTNAILRFLLPLTLLLPALLPYLPVRRAAPQKLPTTESSIVTSLSDIATLRTLMPTLPVLPPVPLVTALRVSSVLYLPYVLTTYLVPMPILLGVAGTVIFSYRAPWACTLRTVLGRSAYVQWFLLRVWFIVSGSEDSLLTNINAQEDSAFGGERNTSASARTSPPTRFNFTILECQRWWMGLDWTAALLPGERPSWCSVSHQPVPPPSVFSLPQPTCVFLPGGNGKRVKRTATWRWEDGEWGLLIDNDGAGAQRVEKKPPRLEEEEGGSRIAARAANMLKERTASIGSGSSDAPSVKDDRETVTSANGAGTEQQPGEELHTDADGWVYADNKWEAASAKGGLGKYTRYRRWTRIAVLEETVEDVGPGELGTLGDTVDHPRKEKPADEHSLRDEKEQSVTKLSNSPMKEHDPLKGRSGEEKGSPLKERLKIAVQGVRNAS